MSYPDEQNLTQLATLQAYLDPPPKGGISQINVTAGGTGYTSAPSVAINDPTGTGAAATAVISNGSLVAINVTALGSNYTNPSIVLSGGGGSGAAATAYVGTSAAMQALINRASAVIVGATGLDTLFDSGSNIVEVRNGNGQDRLQTKVRPIISISSLTVSVQPQFYTVGGLLQPTTIPPTDSSATQSGYIFDGDTIYMIGGYIFTKGYQNVTITYRAGYVLNSSVQMRLEQAALVTCSLWWKRRPHIENASLSNPTVGTTAFTQKDLPAEAWDVINQIRRYVPFE